MGFILTLNEGVKGKKLTCEYKESEVMPSTVFQNLYENQCQDTMWHSIFYVRTSNHGIATDFEETDSLIVL